MKIDLEYPYNEKWNKGYLVTNKDPRKTVILFNNEGDRSSTSYARYLMSCFLKRFLSRKEHVDHIDNNKQNDVIGNLQILTPKENNKKSTKGQTYRDFICPVCCKQFKLSSRHLTGKLQHAAELAVLSKVNNHIIPTGDNR